MQIKSIVAGAAIALAATIGSASAADQLSTLDGVSAQPMSSAELDSVRGGGTLHFILNLFACGCSAPTRHTQISNNVNAPTGDLTIYVVGNHAGTDDPPPSVNQRHGAHVTPGVHPFRGHLIP